MSDPIDTEKLRALALLARSGGEYSSMPVPDVLAACDEIDALRAEVDRLRSDLTTAGEQLALCRSAARYCSSCYSEPGAPCEDDCARPADGEDR
jgi:hypothetical protein